MARITKGLQFEGGLGNVSAYKMKGTDTVILRTKGGASKRMIATSPKFAEVRCNNSEFGACSKMGMGIRRATFAMRHLADYNTSSPINAIAKAIQKTDKEGELGKRDILLSHNRDMIMGFSFNRELLLDSVLRVPIQLTIDRIDKSARLLIPRIMPDINLKQYGKNPLFRLVASFGVVSDFVYKSNYNVYEPYNDGPHGKGIKVETAWHTVKEWVEEQEIVLNYPYTKALTEHDSIIIALGIEFGSPLSDSLVQPTKNAGCAKIIGVG